MMKALNCKVRFCVKLKKWSWIGLLMLCMTLLVGVWITRVVGILKSWLGKELSRVYSTENIEDLFEQFPNGFTVSQMRVVGDSRYLFILRLGKKESR